MQVPIQAPCSEFRMANSRIGTLKCILCPLLLEPGGPHSTFGLKFYKRTGGAGVGESV